MRPPLRAFAVLSVVVLCGLSTPAAASPHGFGLQLGASFDDDDLLAGVHYILPITHAIDIVPTVDVGTAGGDGALTLSGNLHYNLLPSAETGPYVGMGFSSFSAGPSDDTSDTPDAAGPTVLGGVWFNRHGGTAYSIEGRFGFSGLPAFTVQLGVTF